ncbi:DUF4465 domain-containing protein [Sporocytophaga myxococcoides]|uniref:T9SS type A sorting domain-containing protein n=1 Tax=Sporocytophaga myxococcoides TaxID=153721 RepID=UPI0006882413|nr:DUF4465 domain-containing protein [Sporocytophaga myxococcoides]
MKKVYSKCSQYLGGLKPLLTFCCFLLLAEVAIAQGVSTVDEHTLSPNSYWNGSDGSGGFQSGDAYFYNNYNTLYKSWSGFSYTNMKDTITPKHVNPYSAITGAGYNASGNYIVSSAYSPSSVRLTGALRGKTVSGFFVTNTTNTALSMKDKKNGEFGAKQFGGESGNDEDWYKLTVKGYLNGEGKANSVDFYLADYRSSDNLFDYIVNTWQWVDLTPLGNVDSLSFELTSSDVGEWGMNTPAYFAMDNFNNPQFSGKPGSAGNTAIHKDSELFKIWASGGVISRGFQDISNHDLGKASTGELTGAYGRAGTGLVSLGDSGYATLTFDMPIINGVGPDFAVFEYSFAQEFKELAFVEVSSDGEHFFRFPATSYTDPVTHQIDQAGTNAYLRENLLNNLAGKYNGEYGTPFDLDELKDLDGLDIYAVTYVRVVDVVGSINPFYASKDAEGRNVNDPWPTPFASSGFDLDAVGVINTGVPAGISNAEENRINVYPNPSQKNQFINVTLNVSVDQEYDVQVYDFAGQLVKSQKSDSQKFTISTEGFTAGIYVVKVIEEGEVITRKFVVN